MTDEPRFQPAPNRDPVPERRQLTRSGNDKMLAGVCSGVAAYLGVTPLAVRIAAVVLALWATAPLVLGYVVAAIALPQGDTPTPPVAVDWQANSMRVTWRGALAPYVVSWLTLLVIYGAVGMGTTLLSLLLGVIMGPEGYELAVIAHAPLILLGLLGALYALMPRTWALTLSDAALWVERPSRRPQRIDLDQIEGFHPTSSPFTIHLKDGTLIELSPPPDGPELDVVVDELRRSIDRSAAHDETLKATEGERQRLAQLAGAAQKARDG